MYIPCILVTLNLHDAYGRASTTDLCKGGGLADGKLFQVQQACRLRAQHMRRYSDGFHSLSEGNVHP